MKKPTEEQVHAMWISFQWGLAAPEKYLEGMEDGFKIGLDYLVMQGYIQFTDKALKVKPRPLANRPQPPQESES